MAHTIPLTSILISGKGSNMAALILASQAKNYPTRIAKVISSKPDVKGLAVAKELGIPTDVIDRNAYTTRAAFEADLSTSLTNAGTHIVALAGFMELLSPEFVERWPHMINIHPSLLPAFKGLHTHRRALESGAKQHGCTVHIVTPRYDEGPVLAKSVLTVRSGDNENTLAARVLELEHALYPKVLANYAREVAHAL